jgi:gliding motility-associated-like protein
MKTPRLLAFIIFSFFFLSSLISLSQPGCPGIDAGPNQTVNCNNNCTNLTATALETGATTTYSCSSIPYAPPYPYNTGTAILVNIDDTWSSVINLPFTFCYFGTAYTSLIAGSNGLVSFNTAPAGGYCPWQYSVSCPNSSIPVNSIFGPYHDIDPAVSGNMYYAILGTYPCRTFVVSWNQVAMYSSSCNYLKATHQIVLYESTNVIEVYMQNKPLCSGWNSGNAVVGIQDAAGTTGFTAPGRNTSQWSASNEAWRFTPAGTPNYAITWWDGATQIGTGATVNVCPTQTSTYTAKIVYDVCAGADVTVTDNVTVTYNGSFTFGVTPSQDTICAGESVQFNASPATSYSWQPTTGLSCTTCANPIATPTSTTIYSVTGVDNTSGCTSTVTGTIEVNPIPTSAFTVVSPICSTNPTTITYTGNADTNAIFTWNFNGGTATPGTGIGPHQVTWNAPGTYNVSLSVSKYGCLSSVTTVPVTVSNISTTTSANNNVSCYNGNNGIASTNPVNGISPYQYSWSTTPTQISQVASNLPAGSYFVTITDNAGCSAVDSVVITQPTQLVASITDTNNVLCFGGNTGTATVTASGGVTNYTYSWVGSTSATNTATGFSAGPHSVTVTDANNCLVTIPFTINQPTQLVMQLSNINEGCSGSCNGSISALVSGGSTPYSYVWSGGTQQNEKTINLCVGTYNVTVKDAHNCSITGQKIIGTNSPINATALGVPNPAVAPATVSFAYTGTGGVNFDWDFGDATPHSTDQNPIHIYNTHGTFTVILHVNTGAPDFCEDMVTFDVIVIQPSNVFIPNVFTPNGDGQNEQFVVKSEGLNTESMMIFNRWGEKVYEWNVVGGSWDGTKNNKGSECAQGVYYYVFKAIGFDNVIYERQGAITLLK